MSLTYLGRMAFSGPPILEGDFMASNGDPLVPLVMNAIGKVAIDISAAITGAINLSAQLTITPPTLAITLAALVEFQAALSLGITFTFPSVSFDFSASLQLIADLNLALSLIVQLNALLALDLSASGGIVAVGYDAVTAVGSGTVIAAGLTAELFTGGDVLIFGAPHFPSLLPPIPLPLDYTAQKLKAFLNGITYGFPAPDTFRFDTLAEMSPVLSAAATLEGNAAINYQLDAALKLSANFNFNPPSLNAHLDAMIKFAAYLSASLELALPSVNFALDASVDFAAELNAEFSATLALGLSLNAPIATMYCYHWSGLTALLPAALNAEMATGTWGDHYASDAPTAAPATIAAIGGNGLSWTTLQTFFSGAAV